MRRMKLRRDAIDMTGKQFGYLKVLHPFKRKYKRGVFWKCLCVCGKIATAQGGHLRAGTRVSCGCKAREKIIETGINQLLGTYRRKAKIRNKVFTLSRDVFKKLIFENCFYCGSSPFLNWKMAKKGQTSLFKYNGIDKVDHSSGYIESNCVSCCYYCNHAKLDLSIEDFKKHVERMYKWQAKHIL